ncbi:DUF982 domain-containing protein [Sinorhizobium sp. BG8]|uniref:DUF982 domain-containing protein n=1 Tax=Sinorhizobium sp. BG8 TaxID=2613773 RepID=UPI00193CE841|nr:DUF982 domain-containing protein [Sinorhizobium sp. BG8]QRM57840.1 DUF982 domain-containing protein [Sinorhizobium sp. BG8]
MPNLDILWSSPLTICLQSGLKHTFASVYEALDFLEHEWPVRQGKGYERAVRACRGALLKTTPVAVARETFVAACLEAGMPIVKMPQPYHKVLVRGGMGRRA